MARSCFCDPAGLLQHWGGALARTGQVLATAWEVRAADLAAGALLALLLAAFSVVFSTAVFDEAGMDEFIGVGVGMQSVSIFVGGMAHAFFSDVGVSVASPDLNPSLFFGQMTVQIKRSLSSPDPRVPAPAKDVILATTLAAIIITTMALGLTLYLLGRLRLTRIMQMIPEACLTGFMAALGYLIGLKALRTAIPSDVWDSGPLDPDWWMFSSPAVLLGFVLFIRQRFTLGNSGLVVPLIMIVPLLVFYIAYYSQGWTVQQAREQGWLFPYMNTTAGFQTQWDASWGSYNKVSWSALRDCLPLMLLTLVVVCLDVMIKLAGVRKALFATGLGFEHEMMLAGKANMVSGFFVGCPAYNQPPLTQANKDLVGNQVSRIPTMIAAGLNLVFYMFNFPIVNFFPRFWLSGLIFYVAIGFLAENLLEAGFRLSGKEYLAVWIIVITNAVAGLGWALLMGLVLSASMFAVAYGRDGSIKSICTGDDVRSSVVRSSREDAMLQHLCCTTIVITLNRYVFFGSASQILDVVRGLVEEQARLQSLVHRTKFFVFDFALVEDMDITAMLVFSEMVTKIKSMNDDLLATPLAVGEDGRDATTTTTTTTVATAATAMQDDDILGSSSRMRRRLSVSSKEEGDEEAGGLVLEEEGEEQQQMQQQGLNGGDQTAVRLPRRPVVLFTGLSTKQRKTMVKAKLLGELYDDDEARAAAVAGITDDAVPLHQRRCFETLDLGMEWIEERYLEHASSVRQRWFVLPSFLALHNAAKNVAVTETFEDLLGAHRLPGSSINKYLERIDVHKGETLWRAGDHNPQVYLLQSGRLSAFVDRYGERVRSQTLRRGAFVNEDALLLSRPLDTTLVADTDSVVLALSRDKMKRLSKDFPDVALHIYTNILKYAARTRLIVQRAKQARDLFHEPLADPAVSASPSRSGGLARYQSASMLPSAAPPPVVPPSSTDTPPPLGPGDDYSLFDTNVLNKGLSEGRRIAQEFSRHILSSMMPRTSAGTGNRRLTVMNRTMAALSAPNVAAGRHFSRIVKIEKLDPGLRDDWNRLVQNNDTVVREDDIMRVLRVPFREAQEMMWEADLAGRGTLQVFDLLDTLTTVWEGEIVGAAAAAVAPATPMGRRDPPPVLPPVAADAFDI